MERDTLVKTVATNIETIMRAREMNASSLAAAAAVNPTGVYDILKGKSRSPRLDTIHKLAKALRVPVAYLFEDRSDSDVRDQIIEIFVQLPPADRQRLLQTARAWIQLEDDARP